MKVFIILISLILTKGCSETKNLEQIKIQYVAETRGYYKSVKVENKKFLAIDQRNGKPREIELKNSEWKLLSDLYNDIDLTTFEELIGVTNERDFDKRPFGNLFITKKDKMYQTKGFDHTIPPVEIKPFVDLILEYAKK